MFPVRILGQDDWLVFGRTADGTLVYTVIETDWHWLESPYGGQPIEIDDYNKYRASGHDRIDNAYMLEWVKAHIRDYDWRECDHDTDGTYLGWSESDDEAFIAQSRKTYLPD